MSSLGAYAILLVLSRGGSYYNCMFILIVIVRPLFVVFDYLFFFMIALWPSAGKELAPWLPVYGVLLIIIRRRMSLFSEDYILSKMYLSNI